MRTAVKYAERGAVYAVLILYAVITIAPLYWVFSTAFKPESEAYRYPPTLVPMQPTLDNFVTIFTESRTFGVRPYINSTIYGLGTALLTALLSVSAGYGFSRFRFPGRDPLLLGMLFVNMLPGLAMMVPFFKLYVGLGLYDTYVGLIFVYGVGAAPFAAWLMKGYIDTIPLELEEAALVDGCTRIQALYRVTARLAAPGSAAVAVVAFRGAWDDFSAALMLTSSDRIRPYTVAMYKFVGEYGEVTWHLIATAAVVSILPVVLAFSLFQKYFIAGLTGGALKG